MKKAHKIITQLFVATDQRDWSTVESCFAKSVNLDYSSMSGNPAATVTPTDITTAWQSILPGFMHTHHQISNFLQSKKGDSTHVFCYGTATHYLEDDNGNVWTVVGSYDFDLTKVERDWKITSMIFNFKYQDGNRGLAAKAIENAKSK